MDLMTLGPHKTVKGSICHMMEEAVQQPKKFGR
jgi:hypothetical protein